MQFRAAVVPAMDGRGKDAVDPLVRTLLVQLNPPDNGFDLARCFAATGRISSYSERPKETPPLGILDDTGGGRDDPILAVDPAAADVDAVDRDGHQVGELAGSGLRSV